MKKKLAGWLSGGLLAAAVLGVNIGGVSIARAASVQPGTIATVQQDKPAGEDTAKKQAVQQPCGSASQSEMAGMPGMPGMPGIMQGDKMNPDMMKASPMQTKCSEMMKNVDGQKMMSASDTVAEAQPGDGTQEQPMPPKNAQQGGNEHAGHHG